MEVVIKIHYSFRGIQALRSGRFHIKDYVYKKDPDDAARIVAENWLRSLYLEHPEMVLDKVLYEDKDITELIKAPLD